ncbi:MAG: Fic family protein [Nitrospirae bacterium]|nr:Fic family protein [Nitrospirota bacterium]
MGTPSDLLPQAAKRLDRDILGHLELPSKPRTLAQELARTHNELIRIHPFLDGNGRTTRLFNDLQAVQAERRRPWMQYDVRTDGVDRDAYLHASNAYFQGEKEELEKMIEKALV